jgi:hypothetical protein
MGKSHQNIAGQMKTELEEPLAAFAGAMKERRKIVQGGIEKLLKVKVAQTQQVNKVRIVLMLSEAVAHHVPDPGQIRARMSKDKGLSGTGAYGHGTRGTEEQSQAREDSNQPCNIKHRIRECGQGSRGDNGPMEQGLEGRGR